MNKFRSGMAALIAILAVAMSPLFIAPAQAGDLFMDSNGYKGSYVPAPAYKSWYIRADAAYAYHDEPEAVEGFTYDMTREDYNDTGTIGLGVGHYFSPNVRADITVDYRFKSEMSAYNPAPNPPDSIGDNTHKFDVSQLVVMANLYYDFNSYHGGYKDGFARSRFTPYVGVGLGFVSHWTDEGRATGCGCTWDIKEGHTTEVAAAFMSGVQVDWRRDWKIDAGYRFLYLGGFETGDVVNVKTDENAGKVRVDDVHAHEFRIGVRKMIR